MKWKCYDGREIMREPNASKMQMDDHEEIEILGSICRANKIFIIIIINVVETLTLYNSK